VSAEAMQDQAPAGQLSAEALDLRERACRDVLASAGAIAMQGYASLGGRSSQMKGPQDYLTETDGKVESHIRGVLAQAFPEDGFLGEETGGMADAESLWVVDPIDGTANFMRQIPHFCISIAFVSRGRVELGGIVNPAVGETYFARRGRGATRNGAPIRVADTSSFDRASIEVGWSHRVPTRQYLEKVSLVWALGANVRRAGSGALAIAYVADGRSDGYAELHINAWDCLAGLLMVEEAGGRVSPFLDAGGLANGNPLLAAAPGLAETLSRTVGIPLKPSVNAIV
jgi:myo-inositol-1(or 4)-monophosphatase